MSAYVYAIKRSVPSWHTFNTDISHTPYEIRAEESSRADGPFIDSDFAKYVDTADLHCLLISEENNKREKHTERAPAFGFSCLVMLLLRGHVRTPSVLLLVECGESQLKEGSLESQGGAGYRIKAPPFCCLLSILKAESCKIPPFCGKNFA